MNVSQVLSNIYNAVTGVSVPVQGNNSSSLKAPPICQVDLTYQTFWMYYRLISSPTVTVNLSGQNTFINIVDVPFTLKNWGKIYINPGYFRGENGIIPFAILGAGSSFFLAIIQSIDNVNVIEDELCIGVCYDTNNECFKLCSFKVTGSGKYYYCTNITALAGKTVVALNGTSSVQWKIVTTLASINTIDNRQGELAKMADLDYTSVSGIQFSRPLLYSLQTNIVCTTHGYNEEVKISHPNNNRIIVEINTTDCSSLQKFYVGGSLFMGPQLD
jgi:hypothetical protein